MAKSDKMKKAEIPIAKIERDTLVIANGDPVGMFITRSTDMSLPAKLTKDIPGIKAIVESYIVRANGCNQVASAEAAGKFLTKLNKES